MHPSVRLCWCCRTAESLPSGTQARSISAAGNARQMPQDSTSCRTKQDRYACLITYLLSMHTPLSVSARIRRARRAASTRTPLHHRPPSGGGGRMNAATGALKSESSQGGRAHSKGELRSVAGRISGTRQNVMPPPGFPLGEPVCNSNCTSKVKTGSLSYVLASCQLGSASWWECVNGLSVGLFGAPFLCCCEGTRGS